MIVRSGMFIKSLMNIRTKAPKALAFGAYFLAIHFSLFTLRLTCLWGFGSNK